MKKYTLLPADTYTVINKSVLTDKDNKILSLLYKPIIGYQAISLYETLRNDLDNSEFSSNELNHHHLMSIMQLSLQELLQAREKLEGIGLLKTYIKEGDTNNYVYLLYSPLSSEEIFNHPILNVVLYSNLGKEEYNKLINLFKIPKINLKEYDEITSNFDDVFTSVEKKSIDLNIEINKYNSNDITISKGIDFDQLISSIPSSEYNDKTFDKNTKNLINNLSFSYNLKTNELSGLVRDSLNERGYIDKEKLRKNARNYYQFEHDNNLPTLLYKKQPEYLKKPIGDNSKWAQMVYTFENLTPYEFLKAKYKGAEPTDRDKRLIESLMNDQQLSPGVVNVIIAYTLKTNDEKLTKAYVETIAGQLKRLNVETVEEAMRVTEKEHKKLNKMTKKPTNKKVKEENLPNWFENTPKETNASIEEINEMEDILKELV